MSKPFSISLSASELAYVLMGLKSLQNEESEDTSKISDLLERINKESQHPKRDPVPQLQHPGSLRDYFAIMLVCGAVPQSSALNPIHRDMATMAYQWADRLMEARKPNTTDGVGQRQRVADAIRESEKSIENARKILAINKSKLQDVHPSIVIHDGKAHIAIGEQLFEHEIDTEVMKMLFSPDPVATEENVKKITRIVSDSFSTYKTTDDRGSENIAPHFRGGVSVSEVVENVLQSIDSLSPSEQ